MKVAFLGDLAFLGQFDKSKNDKAEDRLSFLKENLKEYDYVVANLESPLTNRNTTLVCKSMHLKADVCNVELLKYLNVSAVSLANNHIADYGQKGIEDTIKELDRVGIEWFGIGNKSLDTVVKGEKINISGFCCYSTNGTHYGGPKGINLLTVDNLKRQLEENDDKGCFSILSVHWGMEHTNYPAYEHLKLARKLLNSHKAVVCGHHPHIIQGIEKIGHSLAAYSLGNAVFDTCVSRNGRLKVELNENNRKGFIFGVTIENSNIINYDVKGFYIGSDGIGSYAIEQELSEISNQLAQIDDVEKYGAMRDEQFKQVIYSKFGKHDLAWLLARMNYYAIGARVSAIIRNRKYMKEAEKFKNE